MIDIAVVVAIVIYVFGTLAVFMAGLFEWGMAQLMIRHARENMVGSKVPGFWEERLSEYSEEARAAARKVVNAWAWPLMALRALVRIYHDSRESTRE